jgi:translation initiation factor IF-2
MKQTITAICLAISLAILMSLSGCYAWSAASTTATYQVTPDGKLISYTSNKEQQGLELELTEDAGQIKTVKIHVDRSGSLEALATSLAAIQAKIADSLGQLIAISAQAAKAGS